MRDAYTRLAERLFSRVWRSGSLISWDCKGSMRLQGKPLFSQTETYRKSLRNSFYPRVWRNWRLILWKCRCAKCSSKARSTYKAWETLSGPGGDAIDPWHRGNAWGNMFSGKRNLRKRGQKRCLFPHPWCTDLISDGTSPPHHYLPKTSQQYPQMPPQIPQNSLPNRAL